MGVICIFEDQEITTKRVLDYFGDRAEHSNPYGLDIWVVKEPQGIIVIEGALDNPALFTVRRGWNIYNELVNHFGKVIDENSSEFGSRSHPSVVRIDLD